MHVHRGSRRNDVPKGIEPSPQRLHQIGVVVLVVRNQPGNRPRRLIPASLDQVPQLEQQRLNVNIRQPRHPLRPRPQYPKRPISTRPSMRKPSRLPYDRPNPHGRRHPIPDPVQEVLGDPNRPLLPVLPIGPNRQQPVRNIPHQRGRRPRMHSSQVHRERIRQPLPLGRQPRLTNQ